jgi:transposase
MSTLPSVGLWGNRRKHSVLSLINAVFYLNKTGCQWQWLPKDFPPYKTVNSFYNRAKHSGKWDEMRQSLWQDDRYDWKGVASVAVVFRPDAVKVSEADVLERIHHAFSPKHFKRLAEWSPTKLEQVEQVKGASDAS